MVRRLLSTEPPELLYPAETLIVVVLNLHDQARADFVCRSHAGIAEVAFVWYVFPLGPVPPRGEKEISKVVNAVSGRSWIGAPKFSRYKGFGGKPGVVLERC